MITCLYFIFLPPFSYKSSALRGIHYHYASLVFCDLFQRERKLGGRGIIGKGRCAFMLYIIHSIHFIVIRGAMIGSRKKGIGLRRWDAVWVSPSCTVWKFLPANSPGSWKKLAKQYKKNLLTVLTSHWQQKNQGKDPS